MKCHDVDNQLFEEVVRMTNQKRGTPERMHIQSRGLGNLTVAPGDYDDLRYQWNTRCKLMLGEGDNRHFFVFNGEQNPESNAASHMEEPDSTNIIRLVRGDRTAYWKVATNLHDSMGINLMQPGFRGALQFFCDTDLETENALFPCGDITIRDITVNSPGLELPNSLRIEALRTEDTNRTWTMDFPRESVKTSIHLLGSNRKESLRDKKEGRIRALLLRMVGEYRKTSDEGDSIPWRFGTPLPLAKKDSNHISFPYTRARKARPSLL